MGGRRALTARRSVSSASAASARSWPSGRSPSGCACRVRPLRLRGAGQAHGRRAARARRARGRVRLPHHPPAQDGGDDGLDRRRPAGQGEAGHPHRQRGPWWDRRRGGPRRRAALGCRGGRRLRRLRHRAVHRLAAVRFAQRRRHPPSRGVDGRGPGQGRRSRSPSRSIWRWRGTSCPSPSTSPLREVSETVRPFLGLAEQLGRCFACLDDGLPGRLEVEYQGGLAGNNTRS